MHILVIAKKPPYPARDGEAIAIRQMICGLRDAGNQVHLLYFNTEKHHATEADVAASLRITVRSVNLHTRATPLGALRNLFSNEPYHTERFSSALVREAIQAHISTYPTDLIQCEGLFVLTDALAVDKTIPVVYRSHNLEAEIWRDLATNSRNPLKAAYYRLQSRRLERYERQLLPAVSACVPISTADARWYAQHFPEILMRYSPTGIDLPDLPSADIDPQSVYFIGGMDWMPNREGLFWFLREVWPQIIRQCPAARLEAAGRHAPEGLASMMPPGTAFHGEVPDAAAFAADKSICIVPLLSGSGMKIKIAEALGAGKPVVTTSKGANGMPAGMDQHLIVTDAPADFANAVVHLLQNPDTARRSGDAGRKYIADTLDTRALGKQLTQFYQTLRQA